MFFPLTPSFSFSSLNDRPGIEVADPGAACFQLTKDVKVLGEATMGKIALVFDGWMLSSLYCSQGTLPEKIMIPGEGMQLE